MTEENKVQDEQVQAEETSEVSQPNSEEAGDISANELQAKVKNLEEVAKKAQYDYVMLKYDFDSFQRRVEQAA